MKKHLMKTFALAAALVLSLSLTACSPKEEASTGDDTTNTEQSAEPEASADLSDEDYVAKVTELYTAIQTDSLAAMEGVDQTDMTQMVDATKKMVENVKPYYDELATLKTSGQYKEAQEQITTGAVASSKMLDISLELMEMGTNPGSASEEELQKKAEELQAQVATFSTDAQMLATGISTVMAGSTTPAEDAAAE